MMTPQLRRSNEQERFLFTTESLGLDKSRTSAQRPRAWLALSRRISNQKTLLVKLDVLITAANQKLRYTTGSDSLAY
jgi:hypothetical protein